MSSPADTTASGISAEMQREAIRWLHWFGWFALGSVALTWISAVSYSAVRVWIIEDRQRVQYEQIREDLAEIKATLQSLDR